MHAQLPANPRERATKYVHGHQTHFRAKILLAKTLLILRQTSLVHALDLTCYKRKITTIKQTKKQRHAPYINVSGYKQHKTPQAQRLNTNLVLYSLRPESKKKKVLSENWSSKTIPSNRCATKTVPASMILRRRIGRLSCATTPIPQKRPNSCQALRKGHTEPIARAPTPLVVASTVMKGRPSHNYFVVGL
jgi:hypothetical protein